MCIMFFTSHYDGPREHFLCQYHCAHTDCPGTFEAHQKYLLEESRLECSECLAKDGDQVDPDIVPVQYYPPIPHFEIEYVEGKGWVKVCEQGGVEGTGRTEVQEDDQDDGHYAHSFASLSDCDSVTSHWRLDPIFPPPICSTATTTNGKSPAPPSQGLPTMEEAYETRSPHEPPHEMTKVCEVSYESVSPGPEPSQTILRESPFGDSPNTIEHRNLVNRQLATLEHRMAHRQPQRDSSQPAYNVPRPHYPDHFRQAVRREVVVRNPPGHAATPPVTPQPHPRVLPGGPDYGNRFHYMVSTSNTNEVPHPRWGPAPGSGEMTDFSRGKTTKAVRKRHKPRNKEERMRRRNEKLGHFGRLSE
ncbi:unnamed protein product [Alternaria sp. RS040]